MDLLTGAANHEWCEPALAPPFGQLQQLQGYTDCRHYCVSVVDWWDNVILHLALHTQMCF